MARLINGKGFRNGINIQPHKVGFPRRQEILDDIADKGTFLPRPVRLEDMDQSFVDFVNSDERISISIDGKKVPVIFLTIQRWTEFSKTWQFSDEFKNIELPFITIVRQPDIQQGQNQAGLWNIPGERVYTYMKVPTWDGARKGIDVYKVPQPTSVDLTYEVRIFTAKMKDLNEFNEKVQLAFQSRQCYLTVLGHPMPILLESIGDESNIDDFENRRFYIQMFEMKLLGYILNEKDFEVIPTINRRILTMEIDDTETISKSKIILKPMIRQNELTYTFIFKPRSAIRFVFQGLYDAELVALIDVQNIFDIQVLVNGEMVFEGLNITDPIVIHANDIIDIRIDKNSSDYGSFKLTGNLT